YGQLLAGTPLVLPVTMPGCRHCYHLYVVRSRQRDRLQQYLKEHGVGTSIHYPMPIPFQKAYQYLRYLRGAFPRAEQATQKVLALPIYPELTEEALRWVGTLIGSFR